ncbi:phytosulfokine receptor [Pycnococcus provasolii]
MRWVVVAVLALTATATASASATGPGECYCDGWQSVNTLTTSKVWEPVLPGVTYRGTQNHTYKGSVCVPWSEAVRRCVEEGRHREVQFVEPAEVPFTNSLSGLPPPGNQCRSGRLYNIKIGSPTSGTALAVAGPWCFVEEADASANGDVLAWLEERVNATSPSDLSWFRCGGLVPAQCNVPPCEAPKECLHSQKSSDGKPRQLLVANGQFELWAPPSRTWRINYPTVPGPHPDLRQWEYCAYGRDSSGWGSGTSVPIARFAACVEPDSESVHKEWRSLHVDAVEPVDGVVKRNGSDEASAESRALRIHSKSANNQTARVIRTTLGGMATLYRGVRYAAQVDVRCARDAVGEVLIGISTLASLPSPGKLVYPHTRSVHLDPLSAAKGDGRDDARPYGQISLQPALRPLNTSANESAFATIRCTGDESSSKWRTLRLEFTADETARDTSLQLGQKLTGDGFVDFDNAELYRLPNGSSTECDDNSLPDTTSECVNRPENTIYKLREEGGVAMGREQLSALANLLVETTTCSPPDEMEQKKIHPECSFLAKFPFPKFGGVAETEAMLRSMSDDKLLGYMGWSSEHQRTPGSDGMAAIRVLRETFPELAKSGLLRGSGGPNYGSPYTVEELPGISQYPVDQTMWYADAFTGNVYLSQLEGYMNCTVMKESIKPAMCYFSAFTQYLLGCVGSRGLQKLYPDARDLHSYKGVFEGSSNVQTLFQDGTMNELVLRNFNISEHVTLNGRIICFQSVMQALTLAYDWNQVQKSDQPDRCDKRILAGIQGPLAIAYILEGATTSAWGLDMDSCIRDIIALNYSDPNILTPLDMSLTNLLPPPPPLPPPRLRSSLPPFPAPSQPVPSGGGLGTDTPMITPKLSQSPPPLEQRGGGKSKKNLQVPMIVGICTAVFVAIVIIVASASVIRRRNCLSSNDEVKISNYEAELHSIHSKPDLPNSKLTERDFAVKKISAALNVDLKEMAVISSKDLKLGKPVGVGAQGTVYSGEWNGELVAIKIFRVSTSNNESEVQALRKIGVELSILHRIRHPNVLYLYGVCITRDETVPDGKLVQMVTELGECSLRDFMRTNAFLSMGIVQRLRLASGILSGIAYLHENGVCHRDIKPANIILKRSVRKNLIPCVADFGISTVDRTLVTMDSDVLKGTLAYISPEIFSGAMSKGYRHPNATSSHVDMKASDIWALGIVLFEIFAQNDIRGDENYFNIIKSGEMPLIDGATDELVQLSRSCITEDPGERCKASVLSQRLKQILRSIDPDAILTPANIAEEWEEWEVSSRGDESTDALNSKFTTSELLKKGSLDREFGTM